MAFHIPSNIELRQYADAGDLGACVGLIVHRQQARHAGNPTFGELMREAIRMVWGEHLRSAEPPFLQESTPTWEGVALRFEAQ